MNFKQILSVVAISSGTAILSVWGFNKMSRSGSGTVVQDSGRVPANYAGFWGDSDSPAAGPVDFTPAATASVPAVVHIKSTAAKRPVSNNLPQRRSWLEDFFGDQLDMNDFFGDGYGRSRPRAAFGSGVLISADGYIITNNHVVEMGEEFEVNTSDKKTFKARLVGSDPSTDLAVIKIEGNNFPFLMYGNSDNLKLGQWVLAVGYPLNLEATVTAGIVSAKGRKIGINKGNTPIESFIQTDAAVNQGNSGGALVNTNGELIGINSAIASPTGAYAGYSYAIPVNLVKKIVNDIIKYGSVQKAYLGIIPNEEKANKGEEALVEDVAKDGAAAQAGIRKGDVITKINDQNIGTWNELQAQLASFKVGDKVNITFRRDGREQVLTAVLGKNPGNYDLNARYKPIFDKLGADMVTLDAARAKEYGIDGGVLVKKLKEGGLMTDATNIKEGFVIMRVNNTPVKTLEELGLALYKAGNSCMISGIYPGYEGFYQYGLNDLR